MPMGTVENTRMSIPPGPKLVLIWVIALNICSLIASAILTVKSIIHHRQTVALLRETKALHEKAKRLAHEAMALRN